jgi:hypothetical protein
MLVLAGLAIGVVVFEASTILMSTALCIEGRLICIKPRGDCPKQGGTAKNVGAIGGVVAVVLVLVVLEEARCGQTRDYNTELVSCISPYNDINIIMKLVFFHLLIKRAKMQTI